MESVKIKEKGIVHKHYTLADKVFSHGLTIQKPLHMDTGTEQLSKGMVVGGSLVSHC